LFLQVPIESEPPEGIRQRRYGTSVLQLCHVKSSNFGDIVWVGFCGYKHGRLTSKTFGMYMNTSFKLIESFVNEDVIDYRVERVEQIEEAPSSQKT
jgi:hypothetical protein